MYDDTPRKGYIYAGCISLAAHILLLIFLYSDMNFSLRHKDDTSPPEMPSEPMPLPSDWAKRDPGASNFGAPVILADFELDHPTPEPIEENKPTTAAKVTDPMQDLLQEIAAQRDHGITVAEHKKTETKEKTEEEKLIEVATTIQQPIQEKKILDTHKTLARQKPTPAQEKQKDPKRNVTFTDLARGFLERAGSGKDGGMRCNGTGKIPPEEQIKYERYAQRVHWCIQNMFRINKRQLTLPHAVRSVLQVKIERDDDGNVTNMYLLKSSGSVELDQFMVKLFKDASRSFPPFPKFLDKKIFSNVFTLNVDVPATTGANMIMSM